MPAFARGRTALRLGALGLWLVAAFWGALVLGLGAGLAAPGEPGSVLPLDFSAFWAGARVALAEGPVAALDPERVAAVQLFPPHDGPPHRFPFIYPPGFLLLALPLGLLPFLPAYLAFGAVSAGAYAAALRPAAGGERGLWLLALGSPAMLPVLLAGQTTLLWAACLLAALHALGSGRRALAGALLALLSLKPQLCLVLPFALLALRDWRLVGWAGGFTLLLAALPTLVTGPAYWEAWRTAVAAQSAAVAAAIDGIGAMPTWYAALGELGLPSPAASAIQWGVTLAAGAAVFEAWRRPATPAHLRAAVLLLAIPVAAPYAWYYESLLVSAALPFLLRDGFGRRRGEALLVAALWIGVTPLLPVSGTVHLGLVFAPLFTLALVLATLRARRAGLARA